VLQRLAEHIHASENGHAGELVLAIEAVAPAHERDSRARALEVFGRLHVWDTPGNTGVLLYLALDRHAIELIADRGVAAPAEVWSEICAALQERLRKGEFIHGILAAIDAIEQVCAQYCPLVDADHPNTLPDAPVLL